MRVLTIECGEIIETILTSANWQLHFEETIALMKKPFKEVVEMMREVSSKYG